MDWSRLRKLDCGSECPAPLFSIFTGHLPNLRALRFGLAIETNEMHTFVQSLINVESLDVTGIDLEVARTWEMFKKHSSTLKQLVMRPLTGPHDYNYPVRDHHWVSLTQDFPMLEHLGYHAKEGAKRKDRSLRTYMNNNSDDELSSILPLHKTCQR